MINEDRVKELYQLALYDSSDKKQHQQISQYYKSDYVGKEILKSFFSGTIAYILVVVLWVLYNFSEILENINKIDYIELAKQIGIFYLGFMLLYLFFTWAIYALRYVLGRRKLKKYGEHIKNVNRMYGREEKLKQ